MVIIIPGEVPAKKNSRVNDTRTGRSFPSKRYNAWNELAILYCRGKKAKEPVRIDLTFYHGDKRRRDSDNGTTSVFDTLVDAGVITDDRWAVIPHYSVSNLYDKNNPRVEIKITSIN